MEIHKKIEDIILEVLEIPEITNNELNLDVEIDSLTYMQIIVLIEDEFGVEIPDALLVYDGIDTINKIEEYILEKQNKNECD